ncbi:MAG TPA: PAS domain S-box protein, partial [Methanotrichaceae archaeon]|nr:PAS domain S-box protein [Methanotrichaceae archaeon]
MDSGIDSFKLSSSLLEIQKRLEDLRTRCTSDTGNAAEILSDALEKLQVTFEKLSTANEALLLDEAELKLVTNNVPLLLAHVGSDLRYIFVNQPYADWFHLKRSEIIGQHISKVLSNEGYEATLGCIKQVLSGEKVDYEIVVQKESGPHVLHIDFIPQLDEHGTMQSYYTVTQDITARKWVENELKVSRDRFRAIFDKAGMGIVVGDTSGCIEDCNIAFAEMLGYSKEELLQKHFKDITFSEDIDKNLDLFQQMIAGQIDRYQMEKRYIRKDGGWIWCNLATSAIRGDNGKLLQILAVVEDITERKQAEEALHRYELIASHSRDIILFMRRDDERILEANAAATKAYGYSREELLRLTIHDLRAPETHGLTASQMTEADTNGILFETAHRRKDGSTFPVEVSSRSGTIDGIGTLISVVRDITERKRAEETIRQANEEWERTFNTVPDLMAILDRQNRIIRVNQAMADRLGIASDQCVGLLCYEAIHGLSQPPAFCPHVLTCQDGQQHVAEVHEPRLGGDFLVSTTPFYDNQGQFRGTIHVARDITERKAAEEALKKAKGDLDRKVQERTADLEKANKALRESEELARWRLMEIEEIYRNAPAGLCVLDTEMRHVRVNERLAEINGIPAADHIGRTVRELLPDIADAAEEIFRKVRESGKAVLGIEICGKTPAQPGVERFWQTSWLPLKDLHGKVAGINIVVEEITERKHIAEALQRS